MFGKRFLLVSLPKRLYGLLRERAKDVEVKPRRLAAAYLTLMLAQEKKKKMED